LITVALIGILGAIALPQYRAHVIRAHRSDAQASLTSLAGAMERFYTVNDTYAGATLGDQSSDIFPNATPLDGTIKYYQLAIQNAGTAAFTVRATPLNPQEGGYLELDQAGARRWDVNNDGDVSDVGEQQWD
jgi:type IV pilus assembly protein PilE